MATSMATQKAAGLRSSAVRTGPSPRARPQAAMAMQTWSLPSSRSAPLSGPFSLAMGKSYCTPASRPILSTNRSPSSVLAGFDAALIFDCDGVIVETEELHRLAYNASFEAFGLTVGGEPVVWSVKYYDILQNTVGGGKAKMRYHFTTTTSGIWPTTKEGFTPASEDEQSKLIDDLQDKKTEFYKKIVVEVANARPGVLELMDEALATPNLAVAICSAATKAGFEKVVNSIVGPDRLAKFDLVLAGDDVTKKKPDPLIYNLASERLAVPPEDCLVVEDSIVGLKAARGARMPCIITSTPSTADQPFLEGGAGAVLPALAGEGYAVSLSNLFAPDASGALKPCLSLDMDAAQVAEPISA